MHIQFAVVQIRNKFKLKKKKIEYVYNYQLSKIQKIFCCCSYAMAQK